MATEGTVMEEHIDTIEYPALLIGQATRHAAEEVLKNNGFYVAAAGWSDSTSTGWALCICDEHESPADEDTVKNAQATLWDEGWASVEISKINVAV
jgi:hypothetical protein